MSFNSWETKKKSTEENEEEQNAKSKKAFYLYAGWTDYYLSEHINRLMIFPIQKTNSVAFIKTIHYI